MTATLQLNDNCPACLVDSKEVNAVINKFRWRQLFTYEKKPFPKFPKERIGRCSDHLLKVGPFTDADFRERALFERLKRSRRSVDPQHKCLLVHG